MPKHCITFTQSAVMPRCGPGTAASAASMQQGMASPASAIAAMPLGGKACTVAPPRKARPTNTAMINRSVRRHMANNIVRVGPKGNADV